jgi:hypothetical protein
LVRSRQSRSRHRLPRRGNAPVSVEQPRSAVSPAHNVSDREPSELPEGGRALTLGPTTLRTVPNL